MWTLRTKSHSDCLKVLEENYSSLFILFLRYSVEKRAEKAPKELRRELVFKCSQELNEYDSVKEFPALRYFLKPLHNFLPQRIIR